MMKLQMLAMGIFLLFFAGRQIFRAAAANPMNEAASFATEMIPVTARSATPVSSATPDPQPTKTRLLWTRTPIQSPTSMSTSLPQEGHVLEFPFKVGERAFLLHRVREGENFEVLEETYATSAEVILSINDSLSSPLWANSVILISPGVEVVDPEIPAFQTYEVTDPQISIDELAQTLGADAALLKYYNHCPEGCQLAAGDWLIIPHPVK